MTKLVAQCLGIFLASFLLSPLVFAQDYQPVTGDPEADKILAYVTIVMTAVTFVANLPLPKEWIFTRVIRALGANFRAMKNKSNTLLVLLVSAVTLSGCGLLQESVAPVVVECAPDRVYLIDNLAKILEGESPEDVLNRVKEEKGRQFVQCSLIRFLEGPGKPEAKQAASEYLITE